MAEGLEDLWAKVYVIKNEQNEVVVEQKWVDETIRNCLIGKALTRKTVNIKVMRAIFFVFGNCKVIGENMFIFQFDEWIKKERVLMQ